MEIYLCSGKITITKNTTLYETKKLFDPYGFKVTKKEHTIVYYGRLPIGAASNIVVHMYFELETEIISSALIHIYPIKFEQTQKYLISHYGEPTMKKSDYEYIWTLPDGKIEHIIKDRFGDEEGIYFSFN